jgi:pimeloyl-ACP methyl ester carboxylesterase
MLSMPDARVSTGVRLHYEIAGEGEPLLLIPGTGQGAGLWVNQIPVLRARYRCVLLDNRGSGQSEVTDAGYSILQMAEDALALLDQIGIGRAHVCGQSMGALIAQEIAAARPELVASLQLHGTFDRTTDYPHLRRQLEIRRALVERELWDIFGPNSVVWLNPPAYVNEHDAELQLQQERFFKNLPNKTALMGHFQADLAYDAGDRLTRIIAPTLITVGSHDITTLPAYGRAVGAQIPGSEFHVFEGAGHLPFLQFSDEFNRVMRDFLQRHPLGT